MFGTPRSVMGVFTRRVSRSLSGGLCRRRRRRLETLEWLEGRTLLSTYIVTSTADTLTSGSPTQGTLRWAVDQTNNGDVIDFNLGTQAQTINLRSFLEITKSITIDGPGSSLLTVSGQNQTSILQIDSGAVVTISDLTLANGYESSSNLGAVAVNSGANLSLVTDVITTSGNQKFTALHGGAVSNQGTLSVIDSTLSNNLAGSGGAIYNNGGTVVLVNSTLSGNTASVSGGAVFTNGGTVTIGNSTIANNFGAAFGGGIEAAGPVTVTSSTFSGNKAETGGAIDNSLGDFAVTVQDSILAGDQANPGPEFANSVISGGNNLVAETDGSTGWVASDLTGTKAFPLAAKLGSLQNNGGPTQTFLPQFGSPAIGAGANAGR